MGAVHWPRKGGSSVRRAGLRFSAPGMAYWTSSCSRMHFCARCRGSWTLLPPSAYKDPAYPRCIWSFALILSCFFFPPSRTAKLLLLSSAKKKVLLLCSCSGRDGRTHIQSARDLLNCFAQRLPVGRTVESRSSGAMSTAVAEARPAYGFPGSGRKSGGEHEELLAIGKRRSDGFFIEEDDGEEEVLTETSSIGAPSPWCSSIGENSSSGAGGDEGEEEVESKLKEGNTLGCLDALEDSLPIKNGLSSFYSGKSKSFTSLAEAAVATAAANELAKPENPFNKRRRILANWSRRASCSSLVTATYLPPLLAPDHALAEGDEGEEDDSDDDSDEYNQPPHRGKNVRDACPALPLPPPRLTVRTQMGMARRNGHGTFRSPRSFSLSDLQNSGSN